MINEYQFHVSS